MKHTTQNSYNCMCCDKELVKLHDEVPETGVPDWQNMWHGGIVDRITAGYGSSVDMTSFMVAICDECAVKKLKKI